MKAWLCWLGIIVCAPPAPKFDFPTWECPYRSGPHPLTHPLTVVDMPGWRSPYEISADGKTYYYVGTVIQTYPCEVK